MLLLISLCRYCEEYYHLDFLTNCLILLPFPVFAQAVTQCLAIF